MLKQSIFIFCCITLSSCVSQKMQPIELAFLPPISSSTAEKTLLPTQTELLKMQSLDEQIALKQFIKTHRAFIMETTQSIEFPFGKHTPQVSCLPLHACDIALQPGEKITGIYPGDTARWLFEQALSANQMHVIFKPKENDIATNVIITTNKRTYHLNLIATPAALVKSISFYYPDDFLQESKEIQEIKEKIKGDENEQAASAIPFNHLHFNYRIETPLFQAKPRWMPLHIFNDGKQVYVQMPPSSETIVLPAFFVLNHDGELELVNYRIRKPYYIVDQLFQKAVLLSGVGKNQQRVTITYSS